MTKLSKMTKSKANFDLFQLQPVLVTLSSKSDPLWRDYEQHCLTNSAPSSSAPVTAQVSIAGTPSSYGAPANSSDIEDSLGHMILIKRDVDEPVGVASVSSSSITPPEFSTVFPDSSSGHTKSSTMWEDIASSIKKLDPDHADVLLEATPTNALPPVSTVVSGGDYYQTQQPQYSFTDQHIFSTRLNDEGSGGGAPGAGHPPGSTAPESVEVLYSSTGFDTGHAPNSQHPSTTSNDSEMIQMLEFELTPGMD